MKIRKKITEASVSLALTVCLAVGGFFALPAQKAVSAPAQPTSSHSESSLPESSNLSSETSSNPSSEESSKQASSTGQASSGQAQSSKPPAASSKPKVPVSSKPSSSSRPAVQSPSVTVPSGNYVVGYYASWARGSGLPPEKLDASLLTHIHYAFANMNANGDLLLPYPTTDKKNFDGLNMLKQQNPGLKTLISVGGWEYSSNFSAVAASASKRENFARNCVDFLLQYGFDGVDLDWEFPRSADRENFTLLLKEIRRQLNEQSAQDGRKYLLTFAGSPSPSLAKEMDLSAVSSLVDYIFMMGYDIHGPWDSYADFNAPIYITDQSSPQYKISLSDGVRTYKNAGVPAKKIILGMPFYGYKYETSGGGYNGLFSRFSSAGSIGYDKLAANYLSNPDFTRYFDEKARVPYLYDGSTFISYDDESSIAEKVSFAKANSLGGVGAWELSHDKNFRLLKSAVNALR